MLKPADCRVEYRVNPVGVFTEKPRFSWKIETDKNNLEQTAYAIEVAGDSSFSALLWQSGKVNSRQSLLISYAGKPLGGQPLKSSSKYFWRVKIWDNQGEESPWGETAFFVTTLFAASEWKGYFISGEDEDAKESSAGTLVRKEFTLAKDIKAAFLYASAKGLYEAWLNGARVGDYALTPGFTEYQHRLLFQTYDVTGQVVRGANALGFLAGPGWYKGNLAGKDRRGLYGNRTAVVAQLRVEYVDGTVEIIASDDTWKRSAAPVTYSEIYHGERYDARLEQPGWDKPGFDDAVSGASWEPVYVESKDLSLLKPADGLPVKEQEYFKPKAIIKTPQNDTVIDFGQNISGWVRFTVSGKAGDKVRIRHAETLDAAGNFYTANLRSAKQTIEYTLKGSGAASSGAASSGEETYAPHLTFQGFRYIAIDEYPGEIKKENFEAAAIYSDMRPAGTFSCSHPKINQFVSNVRWSMKDNFVDIPTDCPQRDERMGWTGDAQIFVRAAAYLMETAPFFKKWLRDLAASQYPGGEIPHVVPDVLRDFSRSDPLSAGACAWGDAAVIVPWTIYTYFGDRELLEEQYPSMKKWVEYIHGTAEDGTLWNTGFQFGDWVALDAKEGSYHGATPNDLCATAYYAYSTSLLAACATILGKNDDAAKYTKLREDIGAAYKNEFFSPTGRLVAPTQTAHILSLVFGLTPEAYKKRTVETLVTLLAENKNHLTTGFLGTSYILRVLEENDRLDLAYELLLKEDFPSWLYQVNKGATTIWEHWDGLKPDGTMWSAGMNSFNHYAYGAICDWVFSTLGGLDTDRTHVGFARSVIHPCPGGGITWAETKYESGYGQLALRWEISGGNITITVTVPPNTRSEVTLPQALPGIINGVAFAKAAGGAAAVAELGSGTYSFTYPWG